jgi:hypothetical protein
MSSFISGLSDMLRRKKITTPDYNAQSLFTVRTADQLLADLSRENYLKKINDIVKMPNEHFQALYAQLVDNFVEFAQILPMRYTEHLSGIMQEGLRHGLIALELLFETSTKKPQPIYIYAVFSMALLADVVKVISTQKVMISDENGIYIDEWCPFVGSMVEQGAQFYKIREYGGYRQAFLNSANPLLAQRVMPGLGLRWLASNPRIFDMWIAVLTGHEDWAGELGNLLKLLKRQLDESEKKEGLWLENVPMESTEPEAVADAEKFLEWLKDGLENETISVNEKDSFVHILDDGIFIETPDVYDAFNHAYSSYRDFIVLQKQFNFLGITKLSGYDFRFEQYFAHRADTSSRLGFLTKNQHDLNANKTEVDTKSATTTLQANEAAANAKAAAIKASQGVHSLSDTAKKVHQGLIISDPAILYGAIGTVPAVSQQMKDVVINWVQEQALPKLPNQQPVQPSNAVIPQVNIRKR